MAVGVDHARHRPRAKVLVDQRQRGGGDFGCRQRIDDDPAGLAGDDGHVRQVEAPHLPDAVGNLEQPVLRHQRCVAPQAGVDRGRRRAGELRVLGQVADRRAVGITDDGVGPRRDEAARCEIEVLGVGPIEGRGQFGVVGDCRGTGGRAGGRRAGEEQDRKGAKDHFGIVSLCVDEVQCFPPPQGGGDSRLLARRVGVGLCDHRR